MKPSTAARVTGVVRLFGSFAALRDFSYTFETGKSYLITGENGAGKSTLLRILAGLSRPTRGTAELPLATSTSYMAHDSMLYEELTARENLEYFAAMHPPADCMQVEDALSLAGIAHAPQDRPVSKFSQGMRQRVSLARALLSRPRMLLLDEPFSNLDRTGAENIAALLGAMRSENRTVIFTTHHPEIARSVADEELRLHRGALVSA